MNLGRFGCFLLTLVVTDSDCFSFSDSGGSFSTDSYNTHHHSAKMSFL